ncbi:HAMP domain-containing sensor histidine kinase [Bdellovibrio sp. NC01]|uniref:sensor histidine kinase n=1 Tax=Bdellovibrio sp. NC01 TaxID=2220073 RepID=UPI0011598E67|nr:HAMP domain-containing sensor histidine kinase [Bdellovibrio sp. NC01]QDK38406.1 hypothetical protein DOE51_12875 [Bdellovibrio sp. NC01]
MITKPLFRKNYLPFASIVLVFVMIGFASSYLYTRYEKSQMIIRPSPFLRHIMGDLDQDPMVSVPKMRASMDGTEPFRFYLINKEGQNLLDDGKLLEQPLAEDQLEEILSGQPVQIRLNTESIYKNLDISKTTKDNVFFVTAFKAPVNRPSHLMWITVGSLAACALISVAVALFYQFSKYRERALEALEVLAKMKHGNLSARMPTKKFEDLAPLVDAFNQMADDVEHLVENMRKSDHARRQLLQDLAHDLRTPLASLKTFLETLKTADKRLSEEKRHEVVSLCFTEVEYFGNLVEDLLFLAQITEPKYSLGTEEIHLIERVQEQIHVFKTRYPKLSFEIRTNLDPDKTIVIGSTKLIDRMLRNAFENSSSFAKGKVIVDLQQQGAKLVVSIQDDGPGFSERALKEFGYKKASRVLSGDSDNKRISVGIGSVIMREIVQLHSGELRAENVLNQDQVLGSKVSFTLPRV